LILKNPKITLILHRVENPSKNWGRGEAKSKVGKLTKQKQAPRNQKLRLTSKCRTSILFNIP
jgi:hypothetical protein